MSIFEGRLRRPLISAIALGAWALFATRVVPPLIVAAHQGSSSPLLNALLIGRHSHAVTEYLDYWRNITWLGSAWCVLAWWVGPLRRALASPRFFDWAVGSATPGALGAIRFWVCSIMLAMTAWEDLASSSLLPRSMIQAKGLLRVLHALPIGFDRFLANAGALWAFEHLTAALLLMGALGLATRVVLPLSAFCYFVMIGILREYAWFYHTGLIPLYLLVVLCFTPCGDGWSLDRLIRIAKGVAVPEDRPQPVYGWSRYVVWTVVAAVYVAAGLSKLYYGGLAWFGADNMRATLLRTTLAPMEFHFSLSLHVVQAPDAVLIFLAAIGLLSELGFGLVLVSAVARRLLPIGIIATHLGILFLQNILFPDLILLPAIFWDFGALRRSVGRWLDRRVSRVRVFYDGTCGLCGRTVRILRGLDLLERLELVDFRAAPTEKTLSPEEHGVDPLRLEGEMAVVDASGRIRWGFDAYRALAWHVPLGWPFLLCLYLPGVRRVGDRVYAHVAARRAGVCAVANDRVFQRRPPERVHIRGATASLTVGLLLMSWWFTHIEFYPLTTLKMFAALNPPVISYVRPLAIFDDGSRAPARFERWIGAMADSRYREIILVPFTRRSDRRRCDEFLDASIRAANLRAEGPRVTGIDLQLWQWEFAADLANPSHGHLVENYEYYSPPGQ